MIEVYSQNTTNEAVLCERYRELKYATDYAISDRLGMCIGGATSLFISVAMTITQVYGALFAFLLICAFGGVIVTVTAWLVRWAKQLYMKNEVLLLYPLEIKLLEDKLFQDSDYDNHGAHGY